MKRILILAAAAALALHAGAALAQTAPKAKAKAKVPGTSKCIKAGGTGTGVTLDFAKFMSGAAAKNSAKAWGGDAVKFGPVVHKCDSGFPFACSATVKACK